jgi:hypothetical protein
MRLKLIKIDEIEKLIKEQAKTEINDLKLQVNKLNKQLRLSSNSELISIYTNEIDNKLKGISYLVFSEL